MSTGQKVTRKLVLVIGCAIGAAVVGTVLGAPYWATGLAAGTWFLVLQGDYE